MRLKGVLWKPGVNGLGVWGDFGELGPPLYSGLHNCKTEKGQ